MLTPQQLRKLGAIISQETPENTNSLELNLKGYVTSALTGQSFPLGEYLRISPNGRIEASKPEGLKPYPTRLALRSIVRTLTRCVLNGYQIGTKTKDWYKELLKAQDFQKEAEATYKSFKPT